MDACHGVLGDHFKAGTADAGGVESSRTGITRTQGMTELRQMILGFEPRVQARVAAQADYWEVFYHGQAALRDLKQLGKRVALILHGHLDDDTPLMRSLHGVYETAPRTEATILRRVRELLPLWERVNAALGPVTLMLRGRVLDVAAVRELLEAHARAVQTIQDKAAVLKQCRAALRRHERMTDRLNKRWYQVAKAGADEGTALAEALRGITTTAGGWAAAKAVIHTKPRAGIRVPRRRALRWTWHQRQRTASRILDRVRGPRYRWKARRLSRWRSEMTSWAGLLKAGCHEE
ncbi:hypothetical protein [Prosthecobacter sp.]|uniref:hypothetical protein n=1 Tax=Prosthecobacter sp. TaxID=1965333 RepID=UPI002AC8D0AA|nr:hypothetical protein [Prosthecobacter sp.]